MLIEPMPDTFFVLTIEHGGVEYSITPHEDRAYVPTALGMALVKAELARVIDAEAEPPGDAWLDGDKWAPWVQPAWPATVH
jgi:hypothetical protein